MRTDWCCGLTEAHASSNPGELGRQISRSRSSRDAKRACCGPSRGIVLPAFSFCRVSSPSFLHSTSFLCTPTLSSSFPHPRLSPESPTLLVICSVRAIVVPMACAVSGVSLIVALMLVSQPARLSYAPSSPGQSPVPGSKSTFYLVNPKPIGDYTQMCNIL